MQRVFSAFLTKSAIYGEKIALLGPKTKFGIMSHTICRCENWTPQKYIFAVMITIYNTFEELKVAL